MTWRATRLFTKTRDHVIIPNAVIAREPITNFSRPTCEHGVILPIGISYDTPPHKFRRVMSAILASVPGVLKDPKPCLWLDQYADFSINFRVKFYINDYDRLDEIRSAVMYLVWYHFQRAQIVIPFPIRDVRVTSAARPEERSEAERRREEYRRLIDGIDLFQPLAEEERRIVAENLREEVFAEGEPLVRQGDAGDTFYIVRDGRVIVTARRDGRDTVLAHLDAGGFFGEMSLLTGEPRSATVAAEEDTRVLELSSAVFSELLHRNARLAEDLAHRIETRRERYGEAMDAAAGPAPAAAPAPARAALVARIRRFFGLGPQA
jgi:CRP-like cAMP-binding protein